MRRDDMSATRLDSSPFGSPTGHAARPHHEQVGLLLLGVMQLRGPPETGRGRRDVRPPPPLAFTLKQLLSFSTLPRERLNSALAEDRRANVPEGERRFVGQLPGQREASRPPCRPSIPMRTF